MFARKMLALPLTALGLAAWAPAFAAEEPVKADDVYVTATRVEKELHDVPMSVTVLTSKDVEKSAARTVGELLEDVPGVRIENDGSQGLKRVSVRGEDAFRTLALVDGQKISEHKSMSGAALLIAPSRIERIEVIKGPASVLYGSDAIGGVVNIITKKGGTKPVQGEASVGYNGASDGFSEDLSLFGSYEGFKYRVSGSNTNQGNVRTPDGTLGNTGFKQKDGSAFLSYDFSDTFTVGGSYDYFDGEFNATSMDYAKDPNSDFFVKVPEWKREKYALFAEAKNLSEVLARVRFDAFYQRNRKKMENYIKSSSDEANVVVDNFADNITRTTGASVQTDWQLGANNYLIAGYEINYDLLDSDGVSYLNNRVAMSGPMSMVINKETGKFYNGDQLTQAVFAAMETSLPWDFQLNYGVRYTHVRTELTRGTEIADKYTGGMYMGDRLMQTMFDKSGAVTGVDLGSTTDSRPVFNVGLVWTGIENLALRASWAQGFRVPILTEKYIGTAMGSSSGMTYGNPNLDPETSNNFEIGARYTNNGVNLDWALFYSISDDYITSVPIAQTADYIYTNVAKAKSFGSELALSYDFDNGITPYANLTWMRRQYDDGEGFKTFNTATPDWVGRYGVRYRTALSETLDFNADVYARSQSATKYESSDGASNYRLGGFTTANIAFGFDFGGEKQYSVQAEVRNLFDKRYQYTEAILEPGLHANLKIGMKF